MSKNMADEWEYLRSEEGQDLTLFHSRFDWYLNLRNHKEVKATVLDAPDWVNVVALTPDNEAVIVQQFRFGTRSDTLEIPAGIIEDDESPQQAAARELREETGYTSQDWVSLGYVEPNPAFFNNRCYMWLAKDVVKRQEPRPDEGENIHTLTLNVETIQAEIQSGRLRHSLAIAALARILPIWTFEVD